MKFCMCSTISLVSLRTWAWKRNWKNLSHRRCLYSSRTCLQFLHSTVDLRRRGGDIVVYRTGTEEPLPSILLCPALHPSLHAGDDPKVTRWRLTGWMMGDMVTLTRWRRQSHSLVFSTSGDHSTPQPSELQEESNIASVNP